MTNRVVIHTGPVAGSDVWASALEAAGLTVRLLPMIAVSQIARDAAMTARVTAGAPYDAVVVTSRNAVPGLLSWRRCVGDAVVAAVGASTVRTLAAGGLRATVVGDEGAADLTHRLAAHVALFGAAVLWPRGDRALPTVRANLTAAGARVIDPVVYRTDAVAHDARALADALAGAAAAVFTSPSGVEAFVAAVGAPGTGADGLPPLAFCRGPTTARAARLAGFVRTVESPASVPPERVARELAGALHGGFS